MLLGLNKIRSVPIAVTVIQASPCWDRIAPRFAQRPALSPARRHWKTSLRYQPLTLTTLAALVPSDLPGHSLFDEGIADVPLDLEADLGWFTRVKHRSPRLELSLSFSAMRHYVVLGGPHVTLIPRCRADADAIFTRFTPKIPGHNCSLISTIPLQARSSRGPDLDLADRPFAKRELLPIHRVL